MLNKQVKRIMDEMGQLDIVSKKEVAYDSYVDELLKFQKGVSRILFGEEDKEPARLSESIGEIRSMARKMELTHNPQVTKAIRGLEAINKEISISMAGKMGEKRIDSTIYNVPREDKYSYTNVSLADETQETEIDNVILTKTGFLLLEVKNVKSNVTISETGRLLTDMI